MQTSELLLLPTINEPHTQENLEKAPARPLFIVNNTAGSFNLLLLVGQLQDQSR